MHPTYSPSHRKPPHLIKGIILPQIIRRKLRHLVVQMGEKRSSKTVENILELIQPQVSRRRPDFLKIRLELIDASVDLFVLREKLELLAESGHFLCENGKDVLLLCSDDMWGFI